MTSIYDRDLDRNPANHQPLTPLSLLERAAQVFPDRLAIVHGPLRRTYAEFYARSRRLASALAQRGIGRGDTVAVIAANTPAMLECHYGVPMTGGVLNTLNTRLDAAALAFMLDHGEAKVLLVDREFSGLMAQALKLARGKPFVIDYDDPRIRRPRRAHRRDRIRGVPVRRGRDLPARRAARRVGRHRAQLHLRHHRRSQGRRLSSSRRQPAGGRQRRHRRHGPASRLSVDAADVPLQRLVFSVVAQREGGRARLPAAGARQGALRRHRRTWRHPSVRGADRHADPAQRDRRGAPPAAACRALLHRRRAAARRGARPDARGGVRGHAPLRPHRDLWSRRGQRLEGRMERPRSGRTGGAEVAPGRALSRARRARRDGPPRP